MEAETATTLFFYCYPLTHRPTHTPNAENLDAKLLTNSIGIHNII